MQALWREYPDDPDIGTLCAEALMDLHPWDLWTQGQAQPWTPEIVSILERVLQIAPAHPGANHLYVHAIEASPTPGKALVAADRLGKLIPDAGHMVHMPSHIYARVGDWPRAAEANRQAMKADRRYRQAYPRPGFYALYMSHNTHFLAFTAMMRGRSQEALEMGRRLIDEIPEDFLSEYGDVADGYLGFVHAVLMRFGRWEELLALPAPRGNLPVSQALWHFTRASALTALNRLPEARAERDVFASQSARVPASAFLGNNSAADLLAVASRVLEGEMLAQEGNLTLAVAVLEEAVQREDRLRYDEPPDWIQPVRHTLGAVLLRASRAAEAEAVYRADLTTWPDNGWSLIGLQAALTAQGRHPEAQAVNARWRKAWADADVAPDASCYCQAGRFALNRP
jgi:tetratricopeptide (TPR) repeat protein